MAGVAYRKHRIPLRSLISYGNSFPSFETLRTVSSIIPRPCSPQTHFRDLLAAQHALVEKVLPPPFDVLVHAWIDLNSDAPPSFIHGAYFAADGPFRTGPPIEDFEDLMGAFASEIDADHQAELAAEIDRYVYDEALSVFLAAPQALYAVNRHVDFVGHAATFELAETRVTDDHWSRR